MLSGLRAGPYTPARNIKKPMAQASRPAAKAIQIGECAQEIFHMRVCGSVLASVSSATYVPTQPNRILRLGGEGVPPHRRGIRIAGDMLGAETGLPFRAFQESIFLGKECIIIKNAQVWRAPHAVIDEFSPQEVLADRFRDFCRIYRPRNLEGFAPFINTIISRVWPKGSPSKPSVLHPVIEFARPIVETMIEAISGSDLSDILSHGLRLIGLGPGLKPSGDGYPGGLLFAFRQLCRLYQVPRSLPPHHFQSWLNVARVKTNPISFALLADHAHGFNSESLSRFVQALMRQGAIEEAVQQPRELEQLGKRTGIDLMAGLMTGMLLAIQHATPEERPAPARPYR